MKYYQCKIKKDNIIQVIQLPEIYTKIGENIRLKKEDYSWENGWKVIVKYIGVDFDEETINKRKNDYKNQRKASDI